MLPDSRISSADLADATALSTRSKTRIDRELVGGTSVRFAGTATAGFDHIDTDAMEELDEDSLLQAMDSGVVAQSVLDVWDNEPFCRRELLERVDIATPHIAGYSFDGKLRGTEMVYTSLCDYFDLAPSWDSAVLLPPSPVPECVLHSAEGKEESALLALIRIIYDITDDDKAIRPEVLPGREEHAELFTRLRKEYPVRREFSGTIVTLADPNAALKSTLATLGFRLT